MKKQQKINIRPNYYNTQLLVADDFLAEQSYHIKARQRHNLKLHGIGIVKGLKVLYQSDITVTIQPGYAIDEIGREIFLESAEEIDFSEFEPNDIVNVILMYQEGELTETTVANTNTKSIYAVIVTTKAKIDSSGGAGVLLAKVKLDSDKKVNIDKSIDYSETRYAGVAPGLVGSVQLAPELRTGWICSAFHPLGVNADPEGVEVNLRPFKIGPTEAVSPEDKGGDNDGAAGVINIAIPMSVKKLTGFRIAGRFNKDRIDFWLMLGGCEPESDPKKMKPVSKVLIKGTISGEPYIKTIPVTDKDAIINPEYSTLSLWLRCTKRASISLIGVQFEY